ncbi:hypothetical protein LSH36_58g00034 [Paralvinella palmiformis]|uniref:Succinate dehydrogenase assembly factor 4, mitochondrial n=1 Tax=Paralvinella palmiformis TaxID=53620 RepID=A0AAD9K4J6_9ANNE|nr:hypothetical protein LSH36_58g00034 [Paralvinella palmiformis]
MKIDKKQILMVTAVQGRRQLALSSPYSVKTDGKTGLRKAKTPVGQLDEACEGPREEVKPQIPKEKPNDPYAPFPGSQNPKTGEIGGPRGPEPTRYGDWERKGRAIDF